MDELIRGDTKLAKVLAQHRLAHVLSGMGLAECDNIWVTARVKERSSRTGLSLLRHIAEFPENADKTSPGNLR